MKKIFAFILALCIVFALTANAFAASKPTITKQPESATTSKKGSVSFTITVKGKVGSYTWYFINPATGEKLSGQKLAKAGLGVKVQNPNSKKITLSNVPESMHGWQVYCHINGNGYKVDSETVLLLVYGMEPPAGSAESSQEEQPAAEQASAEPSSSEQQTTEQAPAEQSSPVTVPASAENTENVDPDSVAVEQENKTITVTSGSDVLRKLDAVGNVVEMDPVSSLEFLNVGSFIISSEEPIKSWTLNGIRFEPAEPVKEFKVLNVTEDVSVNIDIARSSTISVELDTDHMCRVSCKGCTFTFLSSGIRSASEGEVPSGAPIRVVADSTDDAAKGYRINGQDPQYQGKTSFLFTVTEDVEIILP